MVKVFISWSGETSHKLALLLRDWLPTVVQNIDFWISSQDIGKGDRWSIELSRQLAETSFGIICVDSSNAYSPWLNFEAGAISKSLEQAKVFPLLFGITPTELKGPLAQFQVTVLNKEDLYELAKSLYQAVGIPSIPLDRFQKTFELAWPGFWRVVKTLTQIKPSEHNQNLDRDFGRSNEKGLWIDKVYASTTDLLRIEKEVNEARAQKSNLCHLIEDGVVTLPEQKRNQLMALVENECGHCKQAWGKIEYSVNQNIHYWQDFLSANCSTNECEKYTSYLDEKRKELDKEKEEQLQK
jgi:hypothetical protein